MFYGCSKLYSLNLRNLDTSLVTNTSNIFEGCNSLIYINLINAIIKNNNIFDDIIYEVIIRYNQKLLLCINDFYKFQRSLGALGGFYECKTSRFINGYIICSHGNSELSAKEICSISETNNMLEELFFSEISPSNKKSELINEIKDDLINNYNISEISKGKDSEKEMDENILISLTSTNNQKNTEYQNNNKTTINFNYCEEELKLYYNISQNDSLYIIKIDVKEKGMNIPKIEFELYYPLFNNTLIKLDLTECKSKKIDILIPVTIDNDLNKYNQSSNYYNDFCTKAISDSGTDITLNDQEKYFYQ